MSDHCSDVNLPAATCVAGSPTQASASHCRDGRLPRAAALDAVRGVLALVVVCAHALQWVGRHALDVAAMLSVVAFFVMSAYVLARAWDGRYFAFLLRRGVRLWPLYALCIVWGYAMRGTLPPLGQLLWWPWAILPTDKMVDGSAWSLWIEAFATPFLPALFVLSRRGRVAALAGTVALAAMDVRFCFLVFFALGVLGAAFPLRWPRRMPAPLLFLGRISYSLYLSHWLVIAACVTLFGQIGVAVAVAAAVPVAWGLWHAVERPSIAWSRAITRQHTELRQMMGEDVATPAHIVSVDEVVAAAQRAVPGGAFHFASFPETDYSSPGHYTVAMYGAHRYDEQLFTFVAVDAATGKVAAARPVPL